MEEEGSCAEPGAARLPCAVHTSDHSGPSLAPQGQPSRPSHPPELSAPTQCDAASSGSPFPSPKLVWPWLRGQWKETHDRPEEMPYQHITRRKMTLESMWAKEGNNQIWNVGLLYDSTTSGLKKNTIWEMGEVAHTFNPRTWEAEAGSKPAWFT